jgi:group I intron endonuclease
MSCGIYIIQCYGNGMVYIGQSKTVEKRITAHKSNLLNNRCHNKHMQRAFNKYGKSSFVFELCITCRVEDLDMYERLYIALFNSLEDGFNMESGGNSNKMLSMESRQKMSKAKIGKSNGRKGIKLTEEQRIKLSIAHMGLPSPKKGIKTNKPAWNSGKKGLFASQRRKAVGVTDRVTGEYLGEFQSIQHFRNHVDYRSKNITRINETTSHLGRYMLKLITLSKI